MSEKMMTVLEAANFLKVSKQTIYKILHRGEIEYQKIGRIQMAQRNVLAYRDRNTFGGYPEKDLVIGDRNGEDDSLG